MIFFIYSDNSANNTMAMKTMFMFLTVVVMATSVVQAQNPIVTVLVSGTLYRTSNGNGSTPQAFSGATVQVACSADVAANTPANATTDSNGEFLVVLIPSPNATVNSIVSNAAAAAGLACGEH